jgi:hypothetical protein
VYPGHHYGPTRFSTIGQERAHNRFLLRTDFKDFMWLKEHWEEYQAPARPDVGAAGRYAASTSSNASRLGPSMVEPRFNWTALGAVFAAIGFSTEPRLGDVQLVAGSALEQLSLHLPGP